LPPELSLTNEEKIVSVYSDIWGLGVLMSELTGVAAKPKIYYSDELITLQEMMLNIDPNKRPSAKEVLQYIMEKKSIIGLNPTNILNLPMDNKTTNSFREGFSELINRSSTK
jgi:serine/threonine protein kinase